MTAPSMTMVRRRLTVNFQRSVKAAKPQVMEVVVIPLASPSSPNSDATMVGGTPSQGVLLGNEANLVFFDLVPTDHPDLTDQLLYRIAWRDPSTRADVAHWVVRELTDSSEKPVRVQIVMHTVPITPPGKNGPADMRAKILYDEALTDGP